MATQPSKYRLSTRIEQRPVVPFRKGRISEPGIEYLQLILGRIDEYDAHADSVVYVDDVAIRQEALLIAGDDELKGQSWMELTKWRM